MDNPVIPLSTVKIMFALIAGFLAVAFGLYCWKFGENPTATSSYFLKLGDAFITGAIVGLLVALVKMILDIKASLDYQLLAVPPSTVWKMLGLIVGFLAVAALLYCVNFGGTATLASAYGLKVADTIISAAIVGLFVALVKLIFDLPKVIGELKADLKARWEARRGATPDAQGAQGGAQGNP